MKYLLRVDMKTRAVFREKWPREYQGLGGRGLIARLALSEIDPTSCPLSAASSLVIAPGIFAGGLVPSAERLSLGGKSPLTGGIKESNSGGMTGLALGRLGIGAVVVEGKPPAGDLFLLVISPVGAELVPADSLRGKVTSEATALLRKKYGSQAAVLCIGPAGERQALAAAAINTDLTGRSCRANGRGGMGALLASKGLKGVVILPGGQPARQAKDREALEAALLTFRQAVTGSAQCKNYRALGTMQTMDLANNLGCLPTGNFRRGYFEAAAQMGGEPFRKLILSRGGEGTPTAACVPGCLICCSNVFPDARGRELAAPLNYQPVASLGPNLGLANLDDIASLYCLCNDLGMDVVEAGASLALLMEEGKIPWGDAGTIARVLREAAFGKGPYAWVADGVVAAADALGVKRVPAVKGQAFPAYDPRALKGVGVTYATSPQGADHTAGHTLRGTIDHHKPQGQAQESLQAQINAAICDTLGTCLFLMPCLGQRLDILAEILGALEGEAWQLADLEQLGRQVLGWEREFNRRAGFSPRDDQLPEFCRSEPLYPAGTVFDVPESELAWVTQVMDDIS
ncbi:MAG: aldehyde ferredoxin oxidoreductase C-terminal domain-containing protein [bacterium]|nr:aldehyde ferredoxin oxidoreductase C-terminal domain-containing protein [Bacillota bacterium]HHW55445.1 aldehyde ferredoxin oxidoreductase [Bacillota bacterium]